MNRIHFKHTPHAKWIELRVQNVSQIVKSVQSNFFIKNYSPPQPWVTGCDMPFSNWQNVKEGRHPITRHCLMILLIKMLALVIGRMDVARLSYDQFTSHVYFQPWMN